MRTHITANPGDKVAETKISKKDKSRNRREKRIQSVVMSNFNKKYCAECGYRVRGESHSTGSHHALRLINPQSKW